MRVVAIGGTGTIGKAVVNELDERHDVVVVGNQRGDFQCEITSSESIQNLFSEVGPFDALVITTGKIHFADFSEMSEEEYYVGIKSKLMGQVNLVRIGSKFINDNGSFTLTSGILSVDPIRMGSSAAMVNAAIDGFVKGAAIELPRGIRINVVSPTVLKESIDKYEDFFRGYEPVHASRVALAYSKSVEGLQTGQRYTVGY